MKKMKKIIINTLAGMLLGISSILLFNPAIAYAAAGTVTFGSESYICENGVTFPIGVYINADETIGAYYVELEYDTSRMQYVGGAEALEDGTVILKGTATGTEVRYMLQFNAVSGGEAYVEVKYAKVMTAASQSQEELTVDLYGSAPIHISGEDTTGVSGQQDEGATEIPIIEGGIEVEGKTYYLVDLSQYTLDEEMSGFLYTEGTFGDEKITLLTNQERNAKYVYLTDGEQNLYLYGYCEEDGNLYACKTIESDGNTYYLTNALVCSAWPEELTLRIANKQSVYFGVDQEGNSGFYQVASDGTVIAWNVDIAKEENQESIQVYKGIGIAGCVVIAFMALVGIVRMIRNRKYRREDDFVVIDLDEDESTIDEKANGEEVSEEAVEQTAVVKPEEATEKPIISVQNVTMNFKVSTSNASGIKEYIIQLLKRQVTFREFTALDNVSFDVFKGEVVGIIGTNGSGKSTILRIVSGALKPTSGRVEVDTKKIQLLTLGTGFDMELTARENVYLNGAIIGLSEEFLDEHYQEIVDFAELDGFMEEKVKNFSSGMVSRLGFAIATVGEVSEILILDEVLSVGDEFFRKKSLAKVKEMIHSGSTVLMVSHSAQTIIENCTKAVWIERGKLMMIGEPKKVCAEYRKSQEKK